VHSIEEWAAMAQANMAYTWQPGAPMPGYPAAPTQQPGYAPPPPASAPQSGFPDPSQYQQSGFPDPSQYQQSGFPDPSQYQQPGSQSGSQQQQAPPPPASPAGPPPGYRGPESWQGQPPPRRRSWDSASDASTFEDAIGEAVLGAATKAIGRVIGRKMRQAYNERVAPAMAARQESVLNERIAIAQRHPDLRACLRDQVIFLVAGTRVLPLAGAMRVRTVEQSDALVAQLRG
jgi:hypothetical protein